MATREPREINQVRVLNSRTEQAISRVMPRGMALGARTPMGTIVGFKEYKERGDDVWRGVVLEDRGDRVLVSEANTRLTLGSTRTLNKSELVNLGVDRDDEGKVSRVDAISSGDTQRMAFSNGNVVTITHRNGSIPSYELDVRRGAYTTNGEYEVYYNTQGVSKNEALRRLKRELNRIAGI